MHACNKITLMTSRFSAIFESSDFESDEHSYILPLYPYNRCDINKGCPSILHSLKKSSPTSFARNANTGHINLMLMSYDDELMGFIEVKVLTDEVLNHINIELINIIIDERFRNRGLGKKLAQITESVLIDSLIIPWLETDPLEAYVIFAKSNPQLSILGILQAISSSCEDILYDEDIDFSRFITYTNSTGENVKSLF